MINKHWLLGIGLVYGHVLGRSIDPLSSTRYNTKTVNQEIGPLVQTGYYKEVAKNVYLSILFDFSYLDYKYTLRQDYGSANERKLEQKGYKIKSSFTPLQCSYLYKNKFLVSLNLANISYNFRTFDNGSASIGGYLKESELLYSLNPFQNGLTFSYIF